MLVTPQCLNLFLCVTADAAAHPLLLLQLLAVALKANRLSVETSAEEARGIIQRRRIILSHIAVVVDLRYGTGVFVW